MASTVFQTIVYFIIMYIVALGSLLIKTPAKRKAPIIAVTVLYGVISLVGNFNIVLFCLSIAQGGLFYYLLILKNRQNNHTTEKALKLRFCKNCGSQVDPNTNICTGCGKRVFGPPKLSKQKVWNVFSIILIVIFAGFSLYNYWVTGSYQDKLDQSMKDNASLQSELQDYKDHYNKLLGEKNEQIAEFNSFADRIVFVTPEGQKYHKYNCHYLGNARVYRAYDRYNFIPSTFQPCEVCFKSNGKPTLDEIMNYSSETKKSGQYLIDQYGIDPDSETKKSGYTLEDIQAIFEGRATFSYEGVDYKD